MKKQFFPCWLIAALASFRTVAVGADDLPKAFSFARYESMMKRSPFALATVVAPTAAARDFAEDLYIANAARLPNEGLVTLTSITDKHFKEYLSTKSPNTHGYSISKIEWSKHVGATKVTIAKDGQFATLTFNQALLTQFIAATPVEPSQPQPLLQVPQQIPAQPSGQSGAGVNASNPNANLSAIKPAPVLNLPSASARVRGVVQRNPTSSPTPTPYQLPKENYQLPEDYLDD